MAPEYTDQGIISDKADIFSLGVIIIEILIGCRDYPYYRLSTETDFRHFTEKVLNNWRDRFERAPNYTALELHTKLVKQCIDIALACVHPDKEKRPNASNIIEILNAADWSCCDQNGKDLPQDHQMGGQKGVSQPDVLREDSLVDLNKIAMKDHAPVWITKDTMKSVAAPLQPQCGQVLARVDGSLAALRYQGARNASFWVAHKALASMEDNVLRDWAATMNLGPSVEALKQELLSVKAILEFTLGKVIHNMALEDILMELRELVYDAEDVLDELEYFRIQGEQHAKGCAHDLDHNVLPSVHDEPPKLRFDRGNASGRIEHIVVQLKLMQVKVSSATKLLGSDWCTAPNIEQNRLITISESIEPKLYGREIVMKSIIGDITKGKHSREVLTVIAIVGPGGIGKTTLSQHIYHKEEVQQHFQVRVWNCVSLNFNVNKLIEEIQRNIPEVDHEIINGTASELIGQRLKNKRLLLVLDDIWDCNNEDEWKRLLVPFRKSQVQGNIIIVTTRFPAQAQIMVRKKDQSIYLQGIENKEFEELFLQVIFGDDDQSRQDHTFLLETGFRIAGRLKGSPLAAKTVGRLLKTQLDLDHWTRILESKEWEHSNGQNDTMQALKLSFDYLPSQLQHCFSYFALFPQDYKFEKEELINFWIGQEVLHSSHGENKRVEDTGLHHLTELVNYGFLENTGEKYGRTCYIIHDLLHELARKVSSLECLSIDTRSQVSSLQIPTSIRHLSINIDDTSVKDRLTQKNYVEDFNTLHTRLKVEKLQTLMIFGEHHGYFVKAFGDLFREAKALRVIFLSKASYDVEYLLDNLYSLLHLRYLRIESSYPYQAILPKKISRFCHLMVLDVEQCDNIDDLLPIDTSNLIKLRHLLVDYDIIHSSLKEVGKLKSLQELRRFVVKLEDQGFELSQIGQLKQLCGSLCIDDLQNVEVPEEADEAKLMLKSHLHELILCWNINQCKDDFALEEHVLERLKPSRNLQKLSVIGNRGGTCPSWLGMNLSLSNLESLCLDGVAWKTFPPIGDLWSVNVPHEKISINIPEKRFGNLRRLELENLSGLKTWAVNAPCQLFPYLEVLHIRCCSQLVELSFSHSACCCQQGKDTNEDLFSRLLELRIERCPQLLSFPPIPWTKAQCSVDIKEISCLGTCGTICIQTWNFGYSLTIKGKEDTTDSTFWNVLDFYNLTGLTELSMASCEFLPLCYIQMLSSLRTLEMTCSHNSFPFVEVDRHVKYQFPVERLTITGGNTSGKELTQLLNYFPKLTYLNVTGLRVRLKRARISSATINKEKQQQQQGATAERDLLLLPPQLQELFMQRCEQLSILCSNPHGQLSEEDGPGVGLRGLTSLRKLEIKHCPKLLSSYSSSSFSSYFPFPNSLEHLVIYGEVGLEVPYMNVAIYFPFTSLTSLTVYECDDLLGGEGLFSLLAQGHLTRLEVGVMPWVHEQERPFRSSKLQELKIGDVAGFTRAATRHGLLFQSLNTLKIRDDEVKSFTEKQQALLFVNSLEEIQFSCRRLRSLPKRLYGLPKLKRLRICWCKAIQILHKDVLPSSLLELFMEGCPKIQSLPKGYLPDSLQKLVIQGCPAIRSLPKDCLPDSLQELVIRSCPAIGSLPEVDDLPSSLRELDVSRSNCEELKRQCRRFINIIPIVKA